MRTYNNHILKINSPSKMIHVPYFFMHINVILIYIYYSKLAYTRRFIFESEQKLLTDLFHTLRVLEFLN